jgi:hypothetical protein
VAAGGNSNAATAPVVQHGRVVKTSDFDAVFKDARNLIQELTKAPSLPHAGMAGADAAAAGGGGAPPPDAQLFNAAVDMIAREQAAADPASAAVTAAAAAAVRQPTQGHAGSAYYRPRAPTSTGTRLSHATIRPPTSVRSTTDRPRPRTESAASNHGHSRRQQHILERPMDDPARDAYYGGTVDMDEPYPSAPRTPGGKARVKSSRTSGGPRSTHDRRAAQRSSARRTYPNGDPGAV